MRKLSNFSLYLVFCFVLFSRFFSIQAQEPVIRQRINDRQELLQAFDSAKMILTDTNKAAITQLLHAAEDLVQSDNEIITRYLPDLLLEKDSLFRIVANHQSSYAVISAKIKRLDQRFFYAVLSAAALIILTVILFIAWIRNILSLKRLQKDRLSDERLVNEYRKKLIELQNDLENSQVQGKTLITEVSRLEKENFTLKEDIVKAREAGWISEQSQAPYNEIIKDLEGKLATEATQKKILEQELMELLRKVRGTE